MNTKSPVNKKTLPQLRVDEVMGRALKPVKMIKILELDTESHFGQQLLAARTECKITQQQMADLIGCSVSNICHFEKGDNTFGNGSVSTVFKYVKALGFDKVLFNIK